MVILSEKKNHSNFHISFYGLLAKYECTVFENKLHLRKNSNVCKKIHMRDFGNYLPNMA